MIIDVEPTWVEILNMVKSGHLDANHSDLEKACTIADVVRQAQKSGKPSITFTFTEDGQVSYDDGN